MCCYDKDLVAPCVYIRACVFLMYSLSHRCNTQACAENGETSVDGQTSAAFLLKRWDEDDNGTLSYEELHK